MAFCFSGSLLRANFNIVFFLFYIVIVRGKYKCLLLSSSSLLLPDKHDLSVTDRLRHPRNVKTLKSRTAIFQNSLIPYSLTHYL